MLSVNRCSPTSSFVAVSVSILFILFVDIDGVHIAGRWNEIYSVPHKREHVECPESEWIRSGPCNLKMCLKITSSFPTFSDSVCKQVAWPRATTQVQQATSQVELIYVSWSTPNHHHAVQCSDLLNRWLDIDAISDPFRCRLRLSAMDIHRMNLNVDILCLSFSFPILPPPNCEYSSGETHGVDSFPHWLWIVCLQCLVEEICWCFAEEEFLRKYLFRIISIGNQRLNRICWHIVSSFKFVEHYRWLHCWLQVSPDDFRNRMKHWYWKEKGMKMCRDVAIDNVIEQLIFSTVHGLQTNLRKRRIVKQWWSVHSALQWSVNRDLVHGVLF